MSLSNEVLELHGVNVVVKEITHLHSGPRYTHEIINCSGSPQNIRARRAI